MHRHIRSASTEVRDFLFAAQNIERALLPPKLRHALMSRLISRQIANKAAREKQQEAVVVPELRKESFSVDSSSSSGPASVVGEPPQSGLWDRFKMFRIRRASGKGTRHKWLDRVLGARKLKAGNKTTQEMSNNKQAKKKPKQGYEEIIDTRSSDEAGAAFFAPKALNSFVSEVSDAEVKDLKSFDFYEGDVDVDMSLFQFSEESSFSVGS